MPRETIVSVAQFRSIKGKRRQSVAIQFTPKQWKRALDGLTFSSGKPPAEFRGIRLVETPGIGGGFALPECPSPCQFRFQDGKFKCACTAPDDTDPLRGGGGGAFEFCALLVEANGTIRCAGLCAETGRRCSQVALHIPGSRVSLVYCACRRP
ncbi:MAG: hypothetical protein WAU45_09080 [Blastocatellia bacterium]